MNLSDVRVVLSGDTTRLTAALAQAETAMKASGKRMADVGKTLTTRLTLPLAAIGGVSVHMAASFDDSLKKMQALVGIQRDQIEAWRGDIRELAVTYGSSAKEAADAMFFITSAGLRGERAMEALTASLKGSAIGMGDVKTVADAATSAMNAYSKMGLTATRATEILGAAVREGKLEAETLAPVIGSLTGIAASLNVPFEDIAGTLAVFSRTGTDAAEGATSLRSIMSTLINTSDEGERILAKYGLSLEGLRDMIAKPGGLLRVMRLLSTRLGGNIAEFQAIVPNIRAFRGVLNALAQDGATVDGVMRGVADSVGFLEDGLIQVEGPAHEMRVAWAGLKDAFLEVGEVLVPVVIPAIKALSDGVQGLAKTFGGAGAAMQSLVLALGLVGAALGPVLFLFGNLLKTLAALKLSGLITKLSLTGAALSSLAGAAVIGGIIAITAAWLDMRRAVDETEAAVKRANETFKRGLTAADPESARRRVESGRQSLQELEAERRRVQHALSVREAGEAMPGVQPLPPSFLDSVNVGTDAANRFGEALTGPIMQGQKFAEVLSTETNPELQRTTEELRNSLTEIDERIQRTRMLIEANEALAAGASDTEPAATETPTAAAPEPKKEEVDAVTKSWEAFLDEIEHVGRMQEALGADFDATGALLQNFERVIDDLTASGKGLNDTIGEEGLKLQDVVDRYRELRTEYLAVQSEQEAYNNTLGLAKQAVEAASTPLDRYNETIVALHIALAAGDLTWAQFERGIQGANRALEAGKDVTQELNTGIQNAFEDGADAIAEFATTGKFAFAEFVRQALTDLAKLIVRIQVMNLLASAFSFGGGGGGGPQFLAHGGFLAPGELGVVGEDGPEIISGGPSGLTVSPAAMSVPSMAGAGSGDQVSMPVTVNINAVDAQGVADFFDRNEALVAQAFLKAQQRSSTMSRRLG